MSAIMTAANHLAEQQPVVFPIHPRTRNRLAGIELPLHPQLKVVEPVSYLEMLVLLRNANLVITDSGGLQKEAFFFAVPCVTTREQTEWVETVETGANLLVGADEAKIIGAISKQLQRETPLPSAGPWYGEGRAASSTAELINSFLHDPGSQRKVA